MKKMIISAMVCAGFVSAPAFSASTNGVTIVSVGCNTVGVCFANITPNANVASGSTACPNQSRVLWDATTSEGKNFTAQALTAKAADLPMNVGTIDDSCTGGPNDDRFPVLNFFTIAG